MNRITLAASSGINWRLQRNRQLHKEMLDRPRLFLPSLVIPELFFRPAEFAFTHFASTISGWVNISPTRRLAISQ